MTLFSESTHYITLNGVGGRGHYWGGEGALPQQLFHRVRIGGGRGKQSHIIIRR